MKRLLFILLLCPIVLFVFYGCKLKGKVESTDFGYSDSLPHNYSSYEDDTTVEDSMMEDSSCTFEEKPVERIPLENEFTRFVPSVANKVNYKSFLSDYSFLLDGNIVAVGHYNPDDKRFTGLDKEGDWGDRLMYFRQDGSLIQQFRALGDLFMYKPYFYISPDSTQYLILCHRAYEYFWGADVFLVKQKKIYHLGELDVEDGYSDEFYGRPSRCPNGLIDMVRMQKKGQRIECSFDADTLDLNPGSGDSIVYNNNIRYYFDIPK